MGKKKDSSAKQDERTMKITKRFRAVLNPYNKKAYCHITDRVKGKSVSLTTEVMKKMSKKMPDIIEAMKKMDKSESDDEGSSSSDSD